MQNDKRSATRKLGTIGFTSKGMSYFEIGSLLFRLFFEGLLAALVVAILFPLFWWVERIWFLRQNNEALVALHVEYPKKERALAAFACFTFLVAVAGALFGLFYDSIFYIAAGLNLCMYAYLTIIHFLNKSGALPAEYEWS